MHITKVRFWILAILLIFYLIGVLFLSAITLHEPKLSTSHTTRQLSRLKGFDTSYLTGLNPSLKHSKIHWCSKLKYLNSNNRDTVALVSFPGSGNTWLRYLLQQATGFYTGSVYKDYGLLKNGFPAENIMNTSVLVIKTHEWGINGRKLFTKAILLVRSPASAIQAEFNRQSGGHIGFASPDRYRRSKGLYWQQFVNEKLSSWKNTNLDWLYNFTGPTHIIFYEQLINNLEHTLKSVINFLNISINNKLFNCAIKYKEGIYRRKRKTNFDPFTMKMKKKLFQVQQQVNEAIYNYATPVPVP